jgi:CubicO group peptidase (beta-lactamase class C family)
MNEKSKDARLQNILVKQLNSKKILNAVLAVQSGDKTVDWAGAVGYSNQDSGLKMQVDSPFFTASVTKMFTAAVIIHLHQNKLLNIEDNISNHLPSLLIKGIHSCKGVDYTSELKIVHLLNQTSGLADYFLDKQGDGENLLDKIIKYGDYEWGIEDVTNIVRKELTSKFKPGAEKNAYYSDTNYQLLGAIIKSVTDKSLQDAYNEIIYTPLELQNTFLFSNSSLDTKPQPADIYYGNQPMNIPKAMSSFGPDGGIVSNVQESILFLRAFFNGVLFPEHYLREMKQWRRIFYPLEYGYGLMRFKLPRFLSPFKPVPELVGHSGATASFLFYCRDKDLYLAGTLNQIKEQSRPFKLMLDVVNTVL